MSKCIVMSKLEKNDNKCSQCEDQKYKEGSQTSTNVGGIIKHGRRT